MGVNSFIVSAFHVTFSGDNVNTFGTILNVCIPLLFEPWVHYCKDYLYCSKAGEKKNTFHALYTTFTLLTQFYPVKCEMPNIALNQSNW
jgi:hypothetical protein